MGLLSDPEAGHSKWAHFLIKYHRPFCFLLCISAYVWFCLLAHKSFNNGNSYSENALLPGLVRSEFVDDGTAKRLFNELNDEVKENYETRDDLPIPWLAAKMRQMNLDVYTHNFTLRFPLGTKEKFQGENVYGILRAGRSASTEALVISAPYRPLSSHDKTTNAGIALMLAMAKFARSRKYWSKDLIFLVTAHEQLGAQAWLQAYHHTHSDWLDAGDLKGRAGAIQAAINLEMSTLSVKYMEVKVEGLNGQLPNLDLVTLVHKMCVQSSVPHAYKNSFSWTPRTSPWKTWLNSFSTLISMVTTQVTGVPTGNHGLFHRYGIEAVTLMSAGQGGGGGRPAHALEASLRSLNNLLERFHQSYFFYLRTGTDRFLSISQYMPPLGLLVAALFIRAFALWLTSQKQENAKTCDNKDSKDCSEGDTMATNQEISDIDEDSADESGDKLVEKECCDGLSCDNHDADSTPNHLNLMNLLITFLLIHTIGYVVMSSPPFISVLGVKKFALRTEEALFYGLSAFSVLSVLVLPRFFNSLMSPSASGNAGVGGESGAALQQRSLLIVALLELGTLVLAVGMHNFSLGFCLAAVYAPVGLMVAAGGARSQFGRHVTKFLWLLLHPLVLSMLVVFCYTKLSFPEEGFKGLMGRSLDASKQAIIFSVVDGMIYGNWLFNIVTLILLPIWIMFWQILNFKG